MAPSASAQFSNALPIRQPINAKSTTKVKKGLWTSLLESASSGKRLDEKSLVILGA